MEKSPSPGGVLVVVRVALLRICVSDVRVAFPHMAMYDDTD